VLSYLPQKKHKVCSWNEAAWEACWTARSQRKSTWAADTSECFVCRCTVPATPCSKISAQMGWFLQEVPDQKANDDNWWPRWEVLGRRRV